MRHFAKREGFFSDLVQGAADFFEDIGAALINPSPGPRGGETFVDPVSRDVELNTPPGGLEPGITVPADLGLILPIGLGGTPAVPFSLSNLAQSFGRSLVQDIGVPWLASRILPGSPAIMPVSSDRVRIDPFGPFPDQAGLSTQARLVGPAAGVGALALSARGLIQNLLRRASENIGKRITRKNAIALIKRVGIDAAALALGLTVLEMAQIVASEPSRRMRGISGGDIKRTRRTLRKINNLACTLREFCGTGRTSIGRKKAVCK